MKINTLLGTENYNVKKAKYKKLKHSTFRIYKSTDMHIAHIKIMTI